ncbi:hypothetical protein GJAV_G00025620 [Gymnothorax javanicus]|nr:hypothetical protein GJAV_G00025620 [Gymnothorax javanicus]
MMTKPCFLFITLTVCGLSALFVCLVDGMDVGVGCRCLRTSSRFISPRLLRRIEIIPPRAQCRQFKILVTLKDNTTHCFNWNAGCHFRFMKTAMLKRL